MKLRTLTLTALCLAATEAALPCCTAMPAGRKVFLSKEDVVIVWDKEHGVEHFIRQATFSSDAKDFGFIVPTPTKPELAEASTEAFTMLSRLVPPPSRPLACGCSAGETGAAYKSAGVTVLGSELVGKYQATIVKATDGSSLNEWLSKNGYATRPAMVEWLDFYTKKDWVFTAFKFVGDPNQADIATDAVRVSFKTDKPHYPYKMPTDTWPTDYGRPMNVYFVSSTPIQANYDGSNKFWEATIEWTGPIHDWTLGQLATELKLEAADMPKPATLTVFKNGANPDGYGSDLYFSAGRPVLPWSWSWFLVLIVFGGLLYWMKRRSRKMAGTA